MLNALHTHRSQVITSFLKTALSSQHLLDWRQRLEMFTEQIQAPPVNVYSLFPLRLDYVASGIGTSSSKPVPDCIFLTPEFITNWYHRRTLHT